MEPQRLLSTARKIAVQVCSSIVDAHYHSGEIRGGSDDLTQVFDMTKDVLFACSISNDKQLIVTDVVAGAVALLKSFEGIQERITLASRDEQSRLQLARMGVDALLSGVMSLLSCWYMLQSASAKP
jgi:predicted phage tail protein